MLCSARYTSAASASPHRGHRLRTMGLGATEQLFRVWSVVASEVIGSGVAEGAYLWVCCPRKSLLRLLSTVCLFLRTAVECHPRIAQWVALRQYLVARIAVSVNKKRISWLEEEGKGHWRQAREGLWSSASHGRQRAQC
jgi:hypothetical protein